ncbi:LOW QUALITY PROTEIN: hypothetical protein YC2023_027956 [Brassica napus]
MRKLMDQSWCQIQTDQSKLRTLFSEIENTICGIGCRQWRNLPQIGAGMRMGGSKDETFRDLEPGLDGDNIDYAGNNGKNGIVVTKAEEMVAMMEILPLFVYQSNMNKSLETLSTKKPTPRGNSFH